MQFQAISGPRMEGGVIKGMLGLGDKSSECECDLGFSTWNIPQQLSSSLSSPYRNKEALCPQDSLQDDSWAF